MKKLTWSSSVIVAAIALSIVPIAGQQAVFGHGLGNDRSDIETIQRKNVQMVTTITPDVLEKRVEKLEMKVELKDVDAEQNLVDVTYQLRILDSNDNELFNSKIHTPQDKLLIEVAPDSSKEQNKIFGSKKSEDTWQSTSDSVLQINGPLFSKGGLYKIVANVLTVEGNSVSSEEKQIELRNLVTIGEFIPFEVSHEGQSHNLRFATYFDAIDNFEFDEESQSLDAHMPFNWDKEFLKEIPLVHAEYYIPKSFSLFANHKIKTYVNDERIFGIIDRSPEDEIVIHYLIKNNDLLDLSEKMTDENADRIVFRAKPGEAISQEQDKKEDEKQKAKNQMVKFSKENNWKLYFWWEPEGEAVKGDEVTFNVMFHDPETDVMVKDINYDFELVQNGNTVESRPDSHTFSGHDQQDYNFEKSGKMTAKIMNINNSGDGAEFTFDFLSEASAKVAKEETVTIPKGANTSGCETNNKCYLPEELTVEKGTKVTWVNEDNAGHTVTSGTPEKGASGDFDSGLFSGGQSFTHTFQDTETFDYYCKVHPWMTGSVIVQEAAGTKEDAMTKVIGMSKDGSISVEMEASEPMEGQKMKVKLHFLKSDGSSAKHMNYDITATQNGNEILSATNQHPPNHDGKGTHKTQELNSDNAVDFEVTLLGQGLPDDPPSEWTGPKGEIVKFHVVPEFGTIAVLVLISGIAVATALVTIRTRQTRQGFAIGTASVS